MMQKKYIYAAAVISIIIIIAGAYYFISGSDVVKNGDIVDVDFVGYLEDGTIFDTSVESIAKDPSKPKTEDFKVRIIYEPMRFEVGAGKMGLPRLEIGVLGMKAGETKEIRIPPEEARGVKNPDLVISVDRIIKQPIRTSLEREQFETALGEVPVVGNTYQIGDLLARVEEVTDKEVKIFHIVEANTIFQTPYGAATILSVSNDDYTIRIDAQVGEKTTIQGRVGRVTEVTNEKIVIDFNDPLAGQILIFKITLIKIIKGAFMAL